MAVRTIWGMTMAVLRVCYKPGVRFDEAYYLTRHLPLAESVIGPHGLIGVEVVKVNATADGSTPPYQLMFTAHFASEAALRNALQDPQMPQVMNDVRNFYGGVPDILTGEVVPVPA
ncbi:MAG: EthD family reductase [Acidobacteriaceae bacterium]